MGRTAFISHASEDADTAREACAALEAAGVSCWIAPRDVRPGHDYASEILDGISGSRVFVLLLSGEANDSGFVRREVERAASKNKPIYPVRLENVPPAKALELFVSSAHWIDAFDRPRDTHWQRLAAVIRGEPDRAPPQPVLRRFGREAVIGLAALGLIALGAIWLGGDPPAPAPTEAPSSPAEAAAPPPTPTAPATPTASPPPALSDVAPGTSAASDPCPRTLSINPALPTPFSCVCDAGASGKGSVWGTDRYTDDSALCTAAIHAGVITDAGGPITVLREPGHPVYAGTTRNGVRSSDYGNYARSIHFAGAAPAAEPPPCPRTLSINPTLATPYACACSAEAVGEGSVWGSNPYTDDSALCRAAVHAGAVGASGGVITVYREAGRELYVGTARNGVSTRDYGRYARSIRFLMSAL